MHWLGRRRLLVLAFICVFWTGVIVLGHFFPDVPFLSAPWRGEQSFEDLLRREGRKTPAPSDFVFLGIDQSTLQLPPLTAEEIASNRAFQLMTEKPFPWSREVWALLLDRLFAAGARLVMFDMIFSPPNDGDAAFHAALDRYHDKVVLGANFDITPKLRGFVNVNYLRFERTETLEQILFQAPIRHSIGFDSSIGVRYRPPLTENIAITAGAAALIPGQGLKDIYTGRVMYSVFTDVRFQF